MRFPRVLSSLINLSSCMAAGSMTQARADSTHRTYPGVAVVELFTSEGCSSCPPADATLERLARDTPNGSGRVVALSFHVDYWDGLGWPDRFASPDFTARQHTYARVFGDSGLYTPEMVVGGVDHFVGSDGARAEASIARALARPPELGLSLRLSRVAHGSVVAHYDIDGPLPGGCLILLAVVEPSVSVVVNAGENAGRTLRHTNVVRSLTVSPLRTPSGEQVATIPWDAAPGEAEVVAVVQRADGPRAMAVLGAAQSAI